MAKNKVGEKCANALRHKVCTTIKCKFIGYLHLPFLRSSSYLDTERRVALRENLGMLISSLG